MEDTAKPSRALPIGVAAAVAIVVFGVLFAVNGPRGKPDTAVVARGDDKPALTPMTAATPTPAPATPTPAPATPSTATTAPTDKAAAGDSAATGSAAAAQPADKA